MVWISYPTFLIYIIFILQSTCLFYLLWWFWTLIIVSNCQCQASKGGLEDTQEAAYKQKPQDSDFGSFCKFLFPLSNQILSRSHLHLHVLTKLDHDTD